MTTKMQFNGDQGEKFVAKFCPCPKCKRYKTLKCLPKNFKCADLICDFCGYLAQVKTKEVRSIDALPSWLMGAAWGPQKERMDSAIYFPMYLVLKVSKKVKAVYYLSADFQMPELFIKRNKLSEKAKRAGYIGYRYDLREMIEHNALIKVWGAEA